MTKTERRKLNCKQCKPLSVEIGVKELNTLVNNNSKHSDEYVITLSRRMSVTINLPVCKLQPMQFE